MKLLEVHLYGFGKHQQRTFTFSEQTVVVGQNEAGKSSLYEAILQILFGFPTRAASNRLEPKGGGQYGGWLKAQIQQDVYQVERVEGTSSGVVTVTKNGSYCGGDQTLRQLLNGLTREQVEAVFAFHLFDLQKIHQLSQEDLTELFFASGTTGENPYAALKKEAAKEMQTLYRPGGKKPILNQQLDKLKQLEKKLSEGVAEEQIYLELVRQHEQGEHQLHHLNKEISSTKQHLFEADEQQVLSPLFEEYAALNEQLQESTVIDQQDQLNAREWLEQLQSIQLKLQRAVLRPFDEANYNQLEVVITSLETFLEQETEWRENHVKAAELEEQLEAIVRDQQPLLAALSISPYNLENNLENYDLSYEKEMQLNQLITASKPSVRWDVKKQRLLLLSGVLFIVLGISTDWLLSYLIAVTLIGFAIFLPNKQLDETVNAKVTQFLKDYGIENQSSYRASDSFDSLRRLQQLQLSYRQVEERLHQTFQKSEAIKALFPTHLLNGKRENDAFREARKELTKAYDRYRSLQLIQSENEHILAAQQKLADQEEFLKSQLTQLYTSYGVATEVEFQKLVNLSQDYLQKKQRLNDLQRRLQGKERKTLSKPVLLAELDQLEQSLNELMRAQLKLQQQLDELMNTEQRGQLLQQIEEQRELVQATVVDFLAWQTISTEIDALYLHYQQDVFPKTLRRASYLFTLFTANNYQSLDYVDNRFIAITQSGRIYEMKELSQATKEQAYLALRFALAEELVKEKPFVLLMDDPFVHFDAIRFEQVVQWLKSEDNQLPYIYFTCHQEWMSPTSENSIIHLETEGSRT